MGQAAKCEISIYLNNGVETPLDLTSKTSIQQAMLKHYYKTNADAVGEPDITVVRCEIFGGSIELELYSSRRANLDFQSGLLDEYLTQTHGDIIDEVTFDTWVQA
tara:strand:- start:8615 stop:8929 length:315 start_codon:yes stop_codon:yes gene_type:complete